MEILEEILRRNLSDCYDSDCVDKIVDLLLNDLEAYIDYKVSENVSFKEDEINDNLSYQMEDLEDEIIQLERVISDLEEEQEEIKGYMINIETLEDEMKLRWVRDNWTKIDPNTKL
jgi:hypothetical protein